MSDFLYTNFKAEMNRFEEDINQFVLEYPEESHLLEAIKSKGVDPNVDRLFSGMAFLSAQLKTEAENNVDHICDEVLEQHWPFVFQQYPSMMIVESRFISHSKSSVTIPKATPVIETTPLGSERTDCFFSTMKKETLIPTNLISVLYHNEVDCSEYYLIMNFSTGKTKEVDPIAIDKIKIHLTGDKYDALNLYGGLIQHAEKIELCIDDQVSVIDNKFLSTCDDFGESILNIIAGDSALSEPSIIMDFFSFIEKFLFIEISNLKIVDNNDFSIKIYFNCPILKSRESIVDLFDKIKINCMPVINCYKKPGEPFEILPSRIDYPVTVDVFRKESVIPIRVFNVTKGGEGKYASCQSITEKRSLDQCIENVYSIKKMTRKGFLDKLYFHFYPNDELNGKVISYDSWVCNANVPMAFIVPNTKFTIKNKRYPFSFSNLDRPTKVNEPYSRSGSKLDLVSNLSSNLTTLVNLESLKKILSMYVPMNNRYVNNSRYIDCLKSLNFMSQDYFEQGIIKVRSILYVLLDLTFFYNIGEAVLWCQILSRFLLSYAPVNQGFDIIFKSTDEKEFWKFSNREGLRNSM